MVPWILFGIFILAMMALDLGLMNRKSHAVSFKEALLTSLFWIALAFLFNLVVYFWRGPEAAMQFLAGYLIEESLSVDNLFVFLLVFKYFNVPALYLHRVLFWGIFGAIIMRAIFIGVGIALVTRFHWVIYLFGGFLVLTGIKMAFQKDKDLDPEANPVLKLFRRFFPVSDQYEGGKFFIRREGILMATPLFIVLLFIEITDVIFAVDSIPAVFSITLDPFIVYTSNIFAILGLRSLFFVLAGMMDKFRYLQYGLSAILVFVGVKMSISGIYHISTGTSLGVLGLLLAISIGVSLTWPAQPVKES
jgi:tellurite resistance protein TerC